jgi:hypothetical protein
MFSMPTSTSLGHWFTPPEPIWLPDMGFKLAAAAVYIVQCVRRYNQ